ncbi:peptidylprolyl isomerase [Scytonema sp. NUACC26]|uniref:peptidylprolyl isomerase n=1 Tax=Scytonema sp. NUACC26 TaxID=3140176 RepID=UPI0034DC1274
MLKPITISCQEVLQQLKLSNQIPSLIERIVTRNILLSSVAELGIKVEFEELQQAADNIRFTNNLKTVEETRAWLENNHLSLDDFEKMVYINVISGKVAQYLFAEQVEPWFLEHQLDYARAAIYEVILEDKDLTSELFYALQKGLRSFPEVAQQYIQDTELRRCGGYRGILNRVQMKPEISAAVFAANPPQILKPIVTAEGIHLILVEEIMLPQLDDELHYRIISNLFSKWLKQQIEQVKIITYFN